MMACRRATCLWAALLLSFPGRSAASECPAGSGLCRELREEAPVGLGLVQLHAGKAQPARVALQKLGAAGSSGQLPDALTNLIPQPLKDLLGDAAAQGIIGALDSSLSAIENNADILLDRCTAYQADLFSNVSASINNVNTTASERLEDGVAQLQTIVNSRLAPISSYWSLIVNAFQGIGPPVVTGLSGLNLTTTALSVNETFTKLMSAAQGISDLFATTTSTIGKLGNATKEEQETSLQELHVALDDGMTGVTDFKDNLVDMASQLLTSLTKRVSDNSTIPPLQSKVDSLAGKIDDSLDTVLSGTHEAAHLVVRGLHGSAAPALRVWLGLALAAACVGASPAFRPN